MNQVPTPVDYNAFTKLIRMMAKKIVYPCPIDLEDDICQDVYAYFLTQKGQESISKAQNISYLKKQIYFRIIDALRLINKPLKCAILEGNMNIDNGHSYYENLVDTEPSIEEKMIAQESQAAEGLFIIHQLAKIPKVRRNAFICYHWDGLSEICNQNKLSRLDLIKLLSVSLGKKELIKKLDQHDNHIDRVKAVLLPHLHTEPEIIQGIRAYRRSYHRCLQDLKTLASKHYKNRNPPKVV